LHRLAELLRLDFFGLLLQGGDLVLYVYQVIHI
jgi:hypothetical protein